MQDLHFKLEHDQPHNSEVIYENKVVLNLTSSYKDINSVQIYSEYSYTSGNNISCTTSYSFLNPFILDVEST